MARKKKQTEKTSHEQLEDLCELAHRLSLPDGAFDGDLREAADEEADLIYEGIKDSVLLEQLEFLFMRGWQLGRLRELVEEYATQKDE